MRWLFTVLFILPISAFGDVYIAIPSDTSQALYFPNVDTVQCYFVISLLM